MAAVCAKCQTPLTMSMLIDPSDSDSDVDMQPEASGSSAPSNPTNTIPDDVALRCGCHFHWECLLESYEYSKCPNCSAYIVTPAAAPPGTGRTSGIRSEERVIVDLNNEGGLQERIDITPILKEESYLRAYPEERKCRAFLEFCREGDHRAVAELLKSCSEAAEAEGGDEEAMDEGEAEGPQKSADEVLRYQDPVGNMQSGLHAAVANGHREVAWLLLLLASEYPEMEFPALVFQEAAALGVMRSDEPNGKVDIRSLKDAHGRTAEDVAREVGIIWNGWIGNGRLTMPGSTGGGGQAAGGAVTV